LAYLVKLFAQRQIKFPLQIKIIGNRTNFGQTWLLLKILAGIRMSVTRSDNVLSVNKTILMWRQYNPIQQNVFPSHNPQISTVICDNRILQVSSYLAFSIRVKNKTNGTKSSIAQ
jgi:hypothetical protein